MLQDDEQGLSPKEVGKVLGVSEDKAWELMRAQKIKSYRVGRLWRAKRKEVRAYQERDHRAEGESLSCRKIQRGMI